MKRLKADKTCATCYYFDRYVRLDRDGEPENYDFGACKANPPVVIARVSSDSDAYFSNDRSVLDHTIWPQVYADDWCGKREKKWSKK